MAIFEIFGEITEIVRFLDLQAQVDIALEQGDTDYLNWLVSNPRAGNYHTNKQLILHALPREQHGQEWWKIEIPEPLQDSLSWGAEALLVRDEEIQEWKEFIEPDFFI